MTQNEFSKYITEIGRIYKAGNATEHSYRPALLRLLENMFGEIGALGTGMRVTNEPKRIKCGAPDYIVTRNEIPVGYFEAKDIGTDLTGKANKENKEQFDRYRQSLDNLIITDYLTFKWYVRGELMVETAIGEAKGKDIVACKPAFDLFAEIIQDFAKSSNEAIKTSEQLSKMMAAKARLLADSIKSALDEDEHALNVSTLGGQLRGFKEVLIPQITHKEFSDIYAQTIAYGMFAARLRDAGSGEAFTRIKAAQLIPQSNPFLRKLFQYIAGYDLDSRISWMVDALAGLFDCTHIPSIQEEFRKKDHDPMVHFYETFLAEYDPALRKSRGVWYTPPPVVQFIVRAVDDILKTDFNIADGLADTSKITLEEQSAQSNDAACTLAQSQKTFHRVQILDPAAGTGTFLAEIVRNIYRRFENQRGMWRSYVGEHLIPRLHGFEILMASYAMAHLKLDMLLDETGCATDADNRLRIYLTNSLSATLDKTETPFVEWLSNEANEAGSIKKHEIPVMVVLGNPPYSVSSQNKGDWIEKLVADYKKDLKEKNIQPLSDDYIKFIRYGQHFIERNGEGILAYISNNSFIDGLIHCQMRRHLLGTFDKIYILDLHGNIKKKEKAFDGGKDENVFDIQQGVSINIFVKNGKKAQHKLADVFHKDLFGERSEKYSFLQNKTLQNIDWRQIHFTDDNYFFVPKNFELKGEYEKGFKINELFLTNSSGVTTHDDKNLVSFSSFSENNQHYAYRPFDSRNINYDLKKVVRHRFETMMHFIQGANIGLVTKRGFDTKDAAPVFLTCYITDRRMWSRPGMQGAENIFPLYLYPKSSALDKSKLYKDNERKPNFNETIIVEISRRIEIPFVDEPENVNHINEPALPLTRFTPLHVLDYIYAVLHSPAYREKYREFLKIDFPRVPYPHGAVQFQSFAAMGAKLRRLHLMEGVEPQSGMADFPTEGGNEIENLKYVGDKVYINKVQYFDRVPSEAWNFYIGGYQPAQKWLKDRKGRILSYDDIRHYQRIIRVLKETAETMHELGNQLGDKNE